MPGLKLCQAPGCPTLTAGRWCLAHTTRAGHHLYNTKRWRRLRDQVRLEEPFCRAGCGRVTDHIDHIRPHRGDVTLFFDRDNCQGLCVEHHSEKTARGE
jgi:5-methylcytosine-specific restriction protein A